LNPKFLYAVSLPSSSRALFIPPSFLPTPSVPSKHNTTSYIPSLTHSPRTGYVTPSSDEDGELSSIEQGRESWTNYIENHALATDSVWQNRKKIKVKFIYYILLASFCLDKFNEVSVYTGTTMIACERDARVVELALRLRCNYDAIHAAIAKRLRCGSALRLCSDCDVIA
jgi:hypothetical protein